MGVNLEKTEIGTSAVRKGRGWVQTERAAHEEWGRLWIKQPAAAAVLHHLVAFMQEKNAVVIGQKIIADRLDVSERTVRRALEALEKGNWIQIVRIGKGREAAYVINDRVAWGQPRDQLRLSTFSAAVVADARDQNTLTLDSSPLRKIPTLYPGENQLPSGDGLPPPSQPFLPDMEPDLPAVISNHAPKCDIPALLLS